MTENERLTVEKGVCFEDMMLTKGWQLLEKDLLDTEKSCANKFTASNGYDEPSVKAMFELRGRAKAIRVIFEHITQTISEKNRLEIKTFEKEIKDDRRIMEEVSNG